MKLTRNSGALRVRSERAVGVVASLVLLSAFGACGSSDEESKAAPSVQVTGAQLTLLDDSGRVGLVLSLTAAAEDSLTGAQILTDPPVPLELTEPAEPPSVAPGAAPPTAVPLGEQVDKVDLPAGAAVRIGPGGAGLTAEKAEGLKPGTTVPVALMLERAGEIRVQAPIVGEAQGVGVPPSAAPTTSATESPDPETTADPEVSSEPDA